jgi:putative FmdB family regulatory protein
VIRGIVCLEESVPTYQYVCTDCGGQLEVVQKFSDDALTQHDACGGKLRKVFSPVGIVFKGSGFYRTDSRNGSGSSVSSSTSNGSAEDKSGKSEKSADKTEKKSDTTTTSSGSSSSPSSSGSGSGSSAATKVA